MISPLYINNALKFLEAGGIVAVPTDTVYGLAADAGNDSAVLKLFAVKRRPAEKAVPIMISEKSALSDVAEDIHPAVWKLVEKHWPGALTVVLKKSRMISDIVSGGDDTVGIRIPNHEFMLELLKKFGRPLVVTSANISGGQPCTNYQAALDKFAGLIDYIVPGEVKHKQISTVADFTKEPPVILRGGLIQLEINNY